MCAACQIRRRQGNDVRMTVPCAVRRVERRVQVLWTNPVMVVGAVTYDLVMLLAVALQFQWTLTTMKWVLLTLKAKQINQHAKPPRKHAFRWYEMQQMLSCARRSDRNERACRYYDGPLTSLFKVLGSHHYACGLCGNILVAGCAKRPDDLSNLVAHLKAPRHRELFPSFAELKGLPDARAPPRMSAVVVFLVQRLISMRSRERLLRQEESSPSGFPVRRVDDVTWGTLRFLR